MFDSVNITKHSQDIDVLPEVAWTTGTAILLFSPVILIGNGLVLASILLDPFKNIRSSPSSSLIFNLALADFLVGIFVAPLTAVWYIYIAINNTELFSVNIVAFTSLSAVGVSLYTLIALSVDRKIAITAPLQYKHRVTKRKLRIVNICIWICCISFGLPTMLTESYDTFFTIFITISSAHTAVASVALAVLNIAVILSVRTQASQIKRTVDSENQLVLQNAFNREKAVTRITLTVVVAFEICLLPYMTISAAINEYFVEMTETLWVFNLVKVLVFANSLMNPFLYAWRLPKYRKAFQYILNQIKKNVFNSAAQPAANESRDFVSFQDLVSVTNHKSMAVLPKTPQPVCSSVKNVTDIKEHNNIVKDDESIENTKL